MARWMKLAHAWRERRNRVREDVRIFLRVLRKRGRVDRLAALRASLVAEFDDVLAAMEGDRAAGTAQAGE